MSCPEIPVDGWSSDVRPVDVQHIVGATVNMFQISSN